MRVIIRISVLLILGSLLGACQAGLVQEDTVTSTPIQTFVPTTTYTPILPTLTFTPTFTFTPIPTKMGGSTGKLVITKMEQEEEEWTPSIYLYDLDTQQSELVIKGYFLQDISTEDQAWLISRNIEWQPCDFKSNLYILDKLRTDPILISDNFRPTTSVGALNAAWLPETDVILFRSGDGKPYNLFSYNSQGKIQQVTFSEFGVEEFIPSINNGGFLWQEGQCIESQGRVSYTRSLGWRWTKLDGTETTELKYLEKYFLYEISPNGLYSVGWSPFQEVMGTENANMTIELARTDGTIISQLDLSGLITNSTDGVVSIFQWFPNNEEIFIGVINSSPNSGEHNYTYTIISIDGNIIKEFDKSLYLNSESFFPAMESRIWSPDGRLLLYDDQESLIDDHDYYVWDYENNIFIQEPIINSDPTEKLFAVRWYPE